MIRAEAKLDPILFGGSQQYGFRPGTESVALAVGTATALEYCHTHLEAMTAKVTTIRDRFEEGLKRALPDILIHGAAAERLPHTSSVGFSGCDGQVLFTALDTVGIACSIGSACESSAAELSPTLGAMGVPDALRRGSLRFSFSPRQDADEIDEAVRRIAATVKRLRGAT